MAAAVRGVPTAQPPTDASTDDRLAAVELALHRLTVVINSRIAPPVELLTTAEAAKRAKVCGKTIRTWIKLGLLSERRGGRGKGAEHRVLADELDVLITDGEDAVRRFRERMGRA